MKSSYSCQLGRRHRTFTSGVLRKQSGSLMLESLIAMLIFALGVMAMFGLQATAMKHIGEAKYRLDAQFLANELAGTIWANAESAYATSLAGASTPLQPADITNAQASANAAVLAFNCGLNCGASTALNDWLQRVQSTMPGVVLGGTPVAAPGVQITQAGDGSGNQVTITIQWQTSNSRGAALQTHNFQTTAYVNL